MSTFTFPGGTSQRITPVDMTKVDPTEVRALDDLIATFPPTSEVGLVVRDVLQAITWAQHRPGRGVEVNTGRLAGEAL